MEQNIENILRVAMDNGDVCSRIELLLENLIYQQQLANYIGLVALGVGAAVLVCYLMYKLIKSFY